MTVRNWERYDRNTDRIALWGVVIIPALIVLVGFVYVAVAA
ncbi:hypothetical protein PBI_KESHU_40 [Mycobacterium phage Keshu]|uniref:Uncharacterized protein n=1 Tax=Mycobacterium phage Keshu TaxID=1567471 RepID=A0A0B5A3K0_9CAUD|nr:hypothetical protein PBI_KESHU_40 [Mycobacterium phage Keshu]AJD82260.1 hypothetical protein PBI_KESHU_40 [Mycobacterium phage Keshu]